MGIGDCGRSGAAAGLFPWEWLGGLVGVMVYGRAVGLGGVVWKKPQGCALLYIFSFFEADHHILIWTKFLGLSVLANLKK